MAAPIWFLAPRHSGWPEKSGLHDEGAGYYQYFTQTQNQYSRQATHGLALFAQWYEHQSV